MSSSTTTSIRLPQELKARVTKLAAAAGVSTHSFIVEAVVERTAMEEARAEFERVAQKRWQHYRRTGLSVPIDDMRAIRSRPGRGQGCAAAQGPQAGQDPGVIRVEFAQAVSEDFARIAQHLLEHETGLARERIQEIEPGLRVLQHHPEIGRRLDSEHRELMLGEGSRGYVAKYRYLPEEEWVLVTAPRSQKESGCRR